MRYNRFIIATATALGLLSATAATIEITPGSLETKADEEICSAVNLTLTGYMDARDFVTLQEKFTSLQTLDISGVSIVAYAPTRPMLGNQAEFLADCLPPDAFFGMKLTSVVLPSGIEVIGNGAFTGTAVTAVNLPESVKQIGAYAFYDCDALTSITIPAATQTVGDYLFAACDNLKSVDLSVSQISSIEGCSFLNCIALNDVKMPAVLSTIGNGAFVGCESLRSVRLPESVIMIGDKAFIGSGVERLTTPIGLKSVGEFAFAGCKSLKYVEIPNAETTLGRGAFFYCPSLESVNMNVSAIPAFAFSGDEALALVEHTLEGVGEIGDYALFNNKSDKLILYKGLSEIGDNAMEGMDALTEVDATMLGTDVPDLGEKVFEGIPQAEVILKVAEKSAEPWETAEQWKEFDIQETASVMKINKDAEGVKVWFDTQLLNVSSVSNILNISIFSVDGRQVAIATPRALTARIDASGFDENVYIVVVTTDNEVVKFKLVR